MTTEVEIMNSYSIFMIRLSKRSTSQDYGFSELESDYILPSQKEILNEYEEIKIVHHVSQQMPDMHFESVFDMLCPNRS
jgi:hypothetical protein